MFIIIAYDLDTNVILDRWVVELEGSAVEMAEYVSRNPYVIPWHHDHPWRYEVYLTDGSQDIDYWNHPYWN